ncbi:MAG: helix-hairpin-helix domain-containing protein [bacterium]
MRLHSFYSMIGVAVWFLLFLCLDARAGLDDLPVGARSLAMGATYVALANTADAVFSNPGGLAQIRGVDLTLFYQKPFGLNELAFGTAALSFPVWGQRVGMAFSTFGNDHYREHTLRLAYSHSYRQRFFYGIGLDYQAVQIDRYGSAGTVGLDLGFVATLSEWLHWGFSVHNLNRPAMGASEEKLPQVFNFGLSVQPDPRLILNLDVVKDVRFSQEIRFGAEIKPTEALALRAGTADRPSRFSAGFGIQAKRVSVDYAFFTHTDLGVTHQVSLSIRLAGKKRNELPEASNIAQETGGRNRMNQKEVLARDRNPEPKIAVNSATVADLMSLPGIGQKLAQRIIGYREQNGPFFKMEDLLKVPGLGPGKLARIKARILIDQAAQK